MKIMTFAACVLAASATIAQGQEKENDKENAAKATVQAEKESVANTASNSAVQEALAQPDGVSLVRNESDGSLQIFSRGAATYDFGDARDIRSKTKAAELRAKAALSKFFNEVVEVEESATSGEGRMSKAILTQTEDGEVVKKSVTRENMEAIRETLTVRSAAILSGVVTLKTVKIPAEGSKTSGEIQVTLGISTKTLSAAAEAHNMITDSMNARRTIGQTENKQKKPDQNGKKEGANSIADHNKPEVRVNDTIF
jgi:hypothetical protein